MIPGEGFVAGADGGGTSLRFALADPSGGIVTRRSGPAGLVGAGRDREVAEALIAGVRSMAEVARVSLPLDAFCAGLAGTGDTAAAVAVEAAVREAGVARRVSVVSDALIALEEAFPATPGILLIAGTGSVAVARGRAGELLRAGGYGALLADEGSGYRLGLDGLRAAARGADERGPGTALSRVLPEALGLPLEPDPRLPPPTGATVHPSAAWTFAAALWLRDAGKAEVAALAPLVASAAHAGDPLARELVRGTLDALVAHVRALLGRIGGEPVSVAPWGGLITGEGALSERLRARLQAEGVSMREGRLEAVLGAVRLARSPSSGS
jgi:N-acetylglucosamine kinase-like BadF-type ATPase